MADWKPHIRPRLASLGLSPSREAEIAEELAQHLDDRWRELVARGATPEEAAHLARTEFDGARLEALLGTLRQAHWRETPPPGPASAFSFDSVFIDLRQAIRALRATPSFTLGALYQGMYGPAAVTGRVKSDDVVLRVTVKGTNAEFTGKVSSAAKISGTVTGTSDQPRKWSAEKK